MLVGAFSFTTALAAVTFDPQTGTGFVGKGDVQQVFGWNNKQLQDNAESVQFRASSVSETEWTCQRDAGTQTQERQRTTTTQGLVDSIARHDRGKQITGFNLNEYDGDPTTSTEGPEVGSYPTFWSVIEGPTTTSTSTVEVSTDGTNWHAL